MNRIAVAASFCAIIIFQVTARPQEITAAAGEQTTPAPGGHKSNVTFVKNEVMPLDGKGSYSYDIELSDGTKLIQSGRTEMPEMGETESSIVIEGSYAYVAPDGKTISVSYIADKEGFRPKGDVIPSLDYAAGSASGNSTTPSSANSSTPSSTAAAAASSQAVEESESSESN